MGISALIVIIFTIIYIFGNEKMKRIHQLGITIPAILYIIVLLILENSMDARGDLYTALVAMYMICTIAFQLFVCNLHEGLKIKKALIRPLMIIIIAAILILALSIFENNTDFGRDFYKIANIVFILSILLAQFVRIGLSEGLSFKKALFRPLTCIVFSLIVVVLFVYNYTFA